MDLRELTPPINNALVPDIYNQLDARVQERTSVVNGQLEVRLGRQEKVIAKYKMEAEKFRRRQKYNAAKDLKRIRAVPSTVRNIPHFNEKFLRGKIRQLSPLESNEKHYLTKTNEDPICRRCYIHHLPNKKKLYRRESPNLPSSVFDNKKLQPPLGQNCQEKKSSSAPASVTNPSPALQSPRQVADPYNFLGKPNSPPPVRQDRKGKLPPLHKYQFLERESWGRDRDLNKNTFTPRLVSNEEWKDVVTKLCSQTTPRQKPARKPSVVHKGTRLTSFVRENSMEHRTKRTPSRQSSRGGNRVRPPSRPHRSRSNSRLNEDLVRMNSDVEHVSRTTNGANESRKVSRKNSNSGGEHESQMTNGATNSRRTSHGNGCNSATLSAKDLEALKLSSPMKSFIASRSGSVLQSHQE